MEEAPCPAPHTDPSNPYAIPGPAEPWRDAVVEAMMIWDMWPEDGEAPKAALNRLICFEQEVALDPRASAKAQALIDQAKAEAVGGDSTDPIHEWFNLTYASYLTVPRSVLQSMPIPWQRRFVALLHEMGEVCIRYGLDLDGREVRMRGKDGRMLPDPLADYERGRRRLFGPGNEAW